jgi:Site-specific recombinases, DNA invertase Pin homologs
MIKFVAYYRVSTDKQGKSGLGLEAQQEAVNNHLSHCSGELIECFTEVESGKNNNRIELEKALRKCRLTGATLIIARLDRLSRNATFLMSLMDSKVKFVCADMPEANNFTVQILAVMAQYESKLISERTKAALAAAKARGVKLGNPNLHLIRPTDTTKARRAHVEQSEARNAELRGVINELIAEHGGELSLRETAQLLNAANYTTARGKQFQATSVKRLLAA